MIKKSRFTRALFTLALTGTLCFSSILSASAETDSVLTYPYSSDVAEQQYFAEKGLLGFELKTVTSDNQDWIYFTPDSSLKLLCTSADALPNGLGIGTTFVTVFCPNSLMASNGISPEDLWPADAWNMGAYTTEVPYSFGQEAKFVTPELVDYISKNGEGSLIIGFSGSGVDFMMDGDRYITLSGTVIEDFLLTDTTPAAPTETQPASEEAATEAPAQTETPAPVAPAQTDGSDLSYTVAKYDTLGVIALNYYGSYGASSLLYDVNRDILSQTNNRPKEGTQLRLPAVLENYTRIAPPQITGNEKLYCVMAGDTLKSIANKVYGDSSMYQNILNRNSDRIKDANHIYEGQIIVCP